MVEIKINGADLKGGQLHAFPTTVTMHRKVRRWQFPESRFVEFDRDDEEWARPLGYGHEVESIETVVIPNAVITEVAGAFTIKAIASPYTVTNQ